MPDLTLLEYAQSLKPPKTKKAVECMVFRGELKTILKDGRRYVRTEEEPTQSVLSSTQSILKVPLEAVQETPAAEEGMWQAIAEQTELFEKLEQLNQEQARTIKGLNAAINDLLERTVQLETMRQCDRSELTRIGQAVGAYRQAQTREERERPVDGVSQRARPVGWLERLAGQRG